MVLMLSRVNFPMMFVFPDPLKLFFLTLLSKVVKSVVKSGYDTFIRKAYVERGLPKLIPAWKVTFKKKNDFVVLKVYPETSIFLSEINFRGKWLKRPRKTEI